MTFGEPRGRLNVFPDLPPFDVVSGPDAHAAIVDALLLTFSDMQFVRPWMWARPLSDEHRATLSIVAYKGDTYELEIGISCGWVPHLDGARWRWHRTLKQTRRDLWVDHFYGAPSRHDMNRHHGLAYLREQAALSVDELYPRALDWWQSVTEVEGVVAVAAAQAVPPRGLTHVPHPGLVAAFSMAKLGELDAARHWLGMPRHCPPTQLDAALVKLTEVCPSTTAGGTL